MNDRVSPISSTAGRSWARCSVAGCLILVTLIVDRLDLARGSRPRSGFVPADLTIIPPSTTTPLPTATPANLVTPTPEGQIGIGAYVQITGTEGAGLRIRTEPGQGGETVFVGEEEEIFLVKDGPQAGGRLHVVVSRRAV